jgi:CheY-like chemotaxis protein
MTEETSRNTKNDDTHLINSASDFASVYPLKILIVEDNAINQMLFVRLLKKMGYDPKTSNEGYEGIDALKKEIFDVVFMDIYMPELNGFEASSIIQKYWPADRVPIVIGVSASDYSDEDIQKHGMRKMMDKPLNVKEVQKILKEVFKERYGTEGKLIDWNEIYDNLHDKDDLVGLDKCFNNLEKHINKMEDELLSIFKKEAS